MLVALGANIDESKWHARQHNPRGLVKFDSKGTPTTEYRKYPDLQRPRGRTGRLVLVSSWVSSET